MSEKGCLLSKSFNTLSISNKVETKDLFSKNHTKASYHITRETGGEIMRNTIDIFHLGRWEDEQSRAVLPHQGSGAGGIALADMNTIDFPPNSIIESISIILKKDNYIVSNAGGDTDLAIRISISDDGINYESLFEHDAGRNIVLVPGNRSGDKGSFISTDTIIPILSNYRLNDKLDKIRAVSTGGYVNTINVDEMELSHSGTAGTSGAVPLPLYNESTTGKFIGIQLLTIGNVLPLDGFARVKLGEVPFRWLSGMYRDARSDANNSQFRDAQGGTFSTLVTFTKLLPS